MRALATTDALLVAIEAAAACSTAEMSRIAACAAKLAGDVLRANITPAIMPVGASQTDQDMHYAVEGTAFLFIDHAETVAQRQQPAPTYTKLQELDKACSTSRSSLATVQIGFMH